MGYLKTETQERISLSLALASWKDCLTGAVAIVYSPSKCVMARCKDGGLEYHAKEPAPYAIFEVRVFNANAEMRWLADLSIPYVGGDFEGKAVLLTESDEKGEKTHERLGTGQYLLWGTNKSREDGWTELFEHRVGSLWTPFAEDLGEKDRLAIGYVEYTRADTHGNMAVVAERLTGLVKL